MLSIADLGLSAVRAPFNVSADVRRQADTLGISLFLETNVLFPVASTLADTAGWIRAQGSRLSTEGGAASFGLAYAPDTRKAEVCALLAEIAAAVAPIKTHFVSAYPHPDPCEDAVDVVLYRGGTVAGTALAGVGHPAGFGLGLQEQAYARFMPDLLGREAVVFLYRWRDGTPSSFAPRPLREHWGLHAADGSARPAVAVVGGALREGRTVFDRPAAERASRPASRYVLIGWILIILLLLADLRSLRFRAMVARYFTAHGIYRQSVADGRDSLALANLVLLVSIAVLIGLLAHLTNSLVRSGPVVAALWSWAGPGQRAVLDVLLTRPVLLSAAVASLVAISLVAWAGLLYLTAVRPSRGRFGQALTLALWPRWPVLLTLPCVMLVGSGPWSEVAILAACGFVAATGIWSYVRTSIDTVSCMRPGPVRAVLVWLLAPEVVAGVAALVALWSFGEEFSFLRSLAGS